MSSPARILVVNADDFGLTAGVNAGIIGAFTRGIVRSATLMVTTPGFADAVQLAHEYPRLDLGIHLALTNVAPALPPAQIPTLVAADGRFPPLAVWQRRCLLGQLDSGEIRAELTAQLMQARQTGLPFTHLDGHHHIHLFGAVAPIAAELAQAQQISIVRRVRDLPALSPPDRSLVVRQRQGLPAQVKRSWLALAETRWTQPASGLMRTDAFRGVPFPRTLVQWQALINGLSPGVTELMVHPGLNDPTVAVLDSYVAGREQELRWLCDPRVADLLATANVTLLSFRELLRLERQTASQVEHVRSERMLQE